MNEQYSDASRVKNDLAKCVQALDLETHELKDLLEENQDHARVTEDRLKRAEQLYAEASSDLSKEKDYNIELEKSKLTLEKQVKELNVRLVDLESMALRDDRGSVRKLESRIEELASALDLESKEKNEIVKQSRKTERLVKELQFQLAEKDKQKSRFDEEQEKMDQKMKRMKTQLDELETSESNLQLAKRRAEREVAEAKDRATKYEKECDKLKLRMETRG